MNNEFPRRSASRHVEGTFWEGCPVVHPSSPYIKGMLALRLCHLVGDTLRHRLLHTWVSCYNVHVLYSMSSLMPLTELTSFARVFGSSCETTLWSRIIAVLVVLCTDRASVSDSTRGMICISLLYSRSTCCYVVYIRPVELAQLLKPLIN